MYAQTENWSWLYYPPPYSFLSPSAGSSAEIASPFAWNTGLGCPGCGGTCGGCRAQGLGQTGLFGTGLFTSADPNQWGWGEWAVIAVGGFAVISMVTTAQRAGQATGRAYRKVRRKITGS